MRKFFRWYIWLYKVSDKIVKEILVVNLMRTINNRLVT